MCGKEMAKSADAYLPGILENLGLTTCMKVLTEDYSDLMYKKRVVFKCSLYVPCAVFI
jgi:hypothetical protein